MATHGDSPTPHSVTLDPSQAAVVALPDGASAAVIGAPGSGKTTTLIEVAADRVLNRGWQPNDLIVLTTGRVTATRLRDRLAVRLAQPTTGPLARTVNSLAFDIVGRNARAEGKPAPRLITGGEQDSDLAELLAGHIEDQTGPDWPEHLGPEVRRLRGFRTELRELLMRATEYGVTPQRLRELGEQRERPEWVAAAGFITEYRQVLERLRPGQLDSTELVEQAVALLRAGQGGELVDQLKLVIIDDLQEAPESSLAMLRALASRGVAVIAFGDPDVAANAFRGGEPDALGRLATQLGLPQLQTLLLDTVHRQGTALREFTSRITERVGTAAAGPQRRAQAVGENGDDPIVVVHEASPAREWSTIARLLRERHLIGGAVWSDLAVVVRSGAVVPSIARALALAEVPTRTSLGAQALRDDHAARALLTVIDVGMGRNPLDYENASELLLGPIGGLDRLNLRRLRLALRAEELSGDGTRSADELIVDALSAPGRFATIDHRVGRQAEKLAEMLAAVRTAAEQQATIEELLWLVWERSGLARRWFDASLSAGIEAAEANRNLDGVLALFSAAKRFVERLPGAPARNFLESVLDADVPEDTLSPQSHSDAVLVTTPQGVIGHEFDTVVVAALQEGVWPNMRIRGSLLGPQQLVAVVTGLPDDIDERRQVRDDELRMFALAVSRGRNQVVLAAVANEDEAPSVLFSLLPTPVAPVDASTLAPLSLRGLVGRLRRTTTDPRRSAADVSTAASALARLAEEHVPGANPDDWHGLIDASTDAPLFEDDELVPVSPSKLEAFEKSAVDWFIDSVSGSQTSTAMGVGTIVHWAMETVTDPSVDTVWAAIESRWQELLFEAPWVGEQQKAATRILAGGVAEYLGDFERDKKTLVGAESRFTLELGRARVSGSIDRVELAPDGGVEIVDLKTGSPIKAAEVATHPQLGTYQLAYAEGVLDEALAEELDKKPKLNGEHHSGGAKLLFVKKGVRGKSYTEGKQPTLDEEALEVFRERIRQAAIGMAMAEYTGAVALDQWGTFDVAKKRLHRVKAVSSE